MSLFGLRPEEPAAIRIREAATRGTLSHALLLTGSGDRMSAACFAAAALECTGGESRPCGVCPACRKVLAGIHPDVITVRDPDHKNIAVDVVRAIRADAYIRPNEGRRKVYVFPDCALLTEQDQNVLLKVVEEGPPYAAFLFCAENAAVVLQTLRSRHCGESGGPLLFPGDHICRIAVLHIAAANQRLAGLFDGVLPIRGGNIQLNALGEKLKFAFLVHSNTTCMI